MSDHLRKQIRNAVLGTGVLGNLNTTGTRAYVGRDSPLPADNGASLLVDMGPEQIVPQTILGARNRINERSLELLVRGAVKGTSGQACLDTLDAIALEVEQSLGTNQTLGGLTKAVQITLIEEPVIDGKGEKIVGVLDMRFQVIYLATLAAPQTPL